MNQKDLEIVKEYYQGLSDRVAEARDYFGRPLTLTEKIIFSHIAKLPEEKPKRGEDTLNFKPDRVAMQDATAQMAMLQFMTTLLPQVKVPSSIHCDHLIRAESGSKSDLLQAIDENQEVYEFLRTAAANYDIDFWRPGSGIIHQVVLEQYAFPGGMMVGTDSHTPNAGGLGMIAIGVGGADAVDVMAGLPWGLLNPKLIGVKLSGKLSGWTAPKDIILKVADLLTVKGGTGAVIEYFGEGAESLSCTGKGTITNMGAELGATTSTFAYDAKMKEYLVATGRQEVATLADSNSANLCSDVEVYESPEDYYDQLIEINLDELRPGWVGPHTPDLYRTSDQMADAIEAEGYPQQISAALIGSCTNSSYEDISRAASIAKQAVDAGLKAKVPFMVTPGSDQVFQTIKRDGFMEIFEQAGAVVLANACGPCIGQWKRNDIREGEANAIVTSYNRNFKKRNDGSPATLAFIGSPELVTAMAFSGELGFNPLTDQIGDFKFSEPSGDELPKAGFEFSLEGFIPPNLEAEPVQVDPASERIALLERFPAWEGQDIEDLLLLLKAEGKCTTDHISQAGPWLKYRGHLANISKNTYLGAVNAFTHEAGKATNVLTGEYGETFPEVAANYLRVKQQWFVVAGENYGEGSSREHAAMQPRYLGCRAVIVKSFARIAETNLKKQGVLPLTFDNPADYDQILQDANYSLTNLNNLKEDSKIYLIMKSEKGKKKFVLSHSLTEQQIEWFKAGSALNTIKN